VDTTDTLSVANVTYAVDGAPASGTAPAGVSLTGAVLSVDPADAAYEGLAAGETTEIVVSYDVSDGHGGTVTQSATITITGTNDAPVVNALAGTVDEDGLDLSLTASYSDVDLADTHTFSIDTTGTTGSVTDNGDGTFSYDPNGQFDALADGESATDTFTYTVNDGNGGVVTETVTITITGTNDVPVIDVDNTDAAVTGDEDTVITGTVSATDPDEAVGLIYSVAAGDGPANGTVTIDDATGDYSYTPAGDFNGTDGFTVTVTDDQGDTVTQEVTITVDAINHGPVVDVASSDLAVTGDEDDGGIAGAIVANDVDGDELSYALASGGSPSNGSVTFDSNGNFSYVPVADFNGSDNFVVEVSDGNGGAESVTVDVTVNPINDDPASVVLNNNRVNEFALAGAIVGQFIVGDVDTSTGFTFTLIDDANGAFDIDANGQLVVENGLLLDWEQAQTVDIVVQVDDGAAGVLVETLTVDINNLAPEVINGSADNDTLYGSRQDDIMKGLRGMTISLDLPGMTLSMVDWQMICWRVVWATIIWMVSMAKTSLMVARATTPSTAVEATTRLMPVMTTTLFLVAMETISSMVEMEPTRCSVMAETIPSMADRPAMFLSAAPEWMF